MPLRKIEGWAVVWDYCQPADGLESEERQSACVAVRIEGRNRRVQGIASSG